MDAATTSPEGEVLVVLAEAPRRFVTWLFHSNQEGSPWSPIWSD